VLSKLLRDREPEVQVAAAGSILRRQLNVSMPSAPAEIPPPAPTPEATKDVK